MSKAAKIVVWAFGVAAVLLVLLVGSLFLSVLVDRNTAWFPESIPSSARLVQSYASTAGFSDKSSVFVFHVTDDELERHLIDKWQLIPSGSSSYGVMSFVATLQNRPSWWSDNVLEKAHSEYGMTDDGNERYWSLWSDPTNSKLYVEYGNW